MSKGDSEYQPRDPAVHTDELVLPLERLDRSLLAVVGGKAAQLGELIRVGFVVPWCSSASSRATRCFASANDLSVVLIKDSASKRASISFRAPMSSAANLNESSIIRSTSWSDNP